MLDARPALRPESPPPRWLPGRGWRGWRAALALACALGSASACGGGARTAPPAAAVPSEPTPTPAPTAQARGYAALAAGDMAEALAWFDRAISEGDDSPALRHDRAVVLHAVGRNAEALREAALVAAATSAAGDLLLLAGLQARLGYAELGVPTLRLLLDDPAVGDDAAAMLAIALLDGGALDEAAAMLGAAHPTDDPRTWNQRGVVLERQGDVAGAIDAYQRALGGDAELLAAWRNLAMLYLRDGRDAEAERALERYLRLAPMGTIDRALMQGRLDRLRATLGQ